MGTTTLKGSRPMPSRLMTTAGLISRISESTAGSKSTSQISPLDGVRTVDIEILFAERFKSGQFRIKSIIGFRQFGGFRKDRVDLVVRQCSKLVNRQWTVFDLQVRLRH